MNRNIAFLVTAGFMAMMVGCAERARPLSTASLAGTWRAYQVSATGDAEDLNLSYLFTEGGAVTCTDLDDGTPRSLAGQYTLKAGEILTLQFPGKPEMKTHVTSSVHDVITISSENQVAELRRVK